ncbi:MAG: DUF1906 domain-containing protein [Acidithiobacillus sp.]|nr:DUF1906 domain-containing protein [Acidithiobacillus sp.]
MVKIKGIDYAWARPGGAAIAERGYKFAARYLSYDPGKTIYLAEAKDLLEAGLSIVLVWETIAERALTGYAGGVSDAQEAVKQAIRCGQPQERPIYFAVDFDASEAQQATIDDYLRGAASVIGLERIGIYGGYYVCQRCLDNRTARWAWQTLAWSGGQVDERAHIYQDGGTDFDGGADINQARKDDFGQWPCAQNQEEEFMQPIETETMERLDSEQHPHPNGYQCFNSIVDTKLEDTWVILRMPHWLKEQVLKAIIYITDADGNIVWNEEKDVNAEVPEGKHFYIFKELPAGHQGCMVQVDYLDEPGNRLGVAPQIRRVRIA